MKAKEGREAFYQKFGFESIEPTERTLFMHRKQIGAILALFDERLS